MLSDILQRNRETIIQKTFSKIVQEIPKYQEIPAKEVEENLKAGFEAYRELFVSGQFERMEEFINMIVSMRSRQAFDLSDLLGAFTAWQETIISIIVAEYGNDLASLVKPLLWITEAHNLTLRRFASAYQKKINEDLHTMNAELQEAKGTLERNVQEATEELRALQEFNENIIQSMTSGLIVVDKETHTIEKFNRAIETMSGLSAQEALGKPLDEVFAHVHGIPFDDFYREIEKKGLVTRTTQRLTRKEEVVYRSMKADPLYNRRGEAQGVLIIVDDTTEVEFLRESFRKYVSKQVVEKLLTEKQSLQLTGVRQEATILFADIRGFTSISEQLPPEEVVALLNQYFAMMVEVVFQYEGMLDKFVGDNVMAVFGAPFKHDDDPLRAVSAALEMQTRLTQFNDHRRRKGEKIMNIGIGIHTGEVIAGNIGSELRMDYTVIGDTVNLTDRIQAISQQGEIFISEETYRRIKGSITVEPLPSIKFRGRKQGIKIYKVQGKNPGLT